MSIVDDISFSTIYSMRQHVVVGRIGVSNIFDGGLYLEHGYVELVNSDFMGKLCVYYA